MAPAADHRSPEQLTAFWRSHEREIAAGDRDTLRTLDALCGQHDCRSSRLFWYTDLDAAKAQAQREHKPIRSLRLLGKLTDEQSCANSRFFRSVGDRTPDLQSAIIDGLSDLDALGIRHSGKVATIQLEFAERWTSAATVKRNED